MNSFLITLSVGNELIEKIFDEKDRIYLDEIRNIDDLIDKGFSGKIYREGEGEEFYFNFFTGQDVISPAILKCYYHNLKIKNTRTPFLGRFLTHYKWIITRTDFNLTEDEMDKLLDDLKKEFNFEYFVKGEDIIIIFDGKIPYFKLPYPEELQNKNLKKSLPRKKEFSPVRDFILKSSELLEKSIINEIRKDLGQPVANILYLWGNGKVQEVKNINEITGLNCYYLESGESKYEEIADIFGFSRTDNIDFSKDNNLFWITFSPSRESIPVQLKKLEEFDRDVIGKITELDNFKMVVLFEDKNNQAHWINYVYFSCKDTEIKGLRKKMKNRKILFEKLFKDR